MGEGAAAVGEEGVVVPPHSHGRGEEEEQGVQGVQKVQRVQGEVVVAAAVVSRRWRPD